MTDKKIKIVNAKKFEELPCDMRSQCDKSKKQICNIATSLENSDIYVEPSHCTLCKQLGGYETSIHNKGIKLARMTTKKREKLEVRKKAENYFGDGPGTELKKMIPEWLSRPGCGCKNFAKKMNIWGINGCRRNIDFIVQRLMSEKNKLGFLGWVPDKATESVCKKLVNTAIKRAEEKEGSRKHNWFVAVTTAPRKEPTLQHCLDSLLINGWNPYIFAEPGTYDINDEYRQNLIQHEEKKGIWWNWIESCRYALANSDADIIMTVQDDSLFHPDSRVFTEKFLWPCTSTGFVSLYTPRNYSQRQHLKSKPWRPMGLNLIHTKALWGVCALVWPRKVLEVVMEHPMIDSWRGARLKTKSAWESKRKEREENPHTIQNSDTAIGGILNRLNRTMWFFDPSPVQHISKYSATNHGGNTGNRNCGRCAKYSVPLSEQIPFELNGEGSKIFSSDELIFDKIS